MVITEESFYPVLMKIGYHTSAIIWASVSGNNNISWLGYAT